MVLTLGNSILWCGNLNYSCSLIIAFTHGTCYPTVYIPGLASTVSRAWHITVGTFDVMTVQKTLCMLVSQLYAWVVVLVVVVMVKMVVVVV